MHFAQSDKVVYVGPTAGAPFIDADPTIYRVIGFAPVLNSVYVVAAVVCHGAGLALTGSTTIHNKSGIETGWAANCFRKLDEIKAENALARQCVEADYLDAR